ncbi:MAG: PAS domain S-box protein [Anaerolineae bacterium]|nr:PAS domain S-box protein [Anaerolineae bacterium]
MTDTQQIRQLERQLADYDDVSEAAITPKINTLNDLAWALSDIDMQRARSLSETAYTLSQANGNGAEPYRKGMAYSLRTQGYLNQRLGDYPLGLTQLFKAQELCEALNLDEALTDVYDGIAGIYYKIGNFPDSLNYIYKQLEAAQRVDDSRLIANAYNNLANIYFETGDYDRAIETLQHNLVRAAETDFKRIECLSYLNLGETYLLAGNDEAALENGRRGLQVSQAAGFEMFEAYAFDIIGKAYLKLDETDQAITHFEQALALSRAIKSDVTEALFLLNLGQAYCNKQQFAAALKYGREGIKTAEKIEAKSELVKGHLLLSEIYEQQGDFAQALHHFKQYQTFKEMVLGEKADQRLKVLQIAYDTETAKKEAEINRLHSAELEREIAERRRRETQLRLLESVVANTNDAILIIAANSDEVPANSIIYANQALTALTGYTRQELIGQPPGIFRGATNTAILQQIQDAIKYHQRIRTEVISYSKAGTELWVELDFIPVKDESEHASHWVAVGRDITKRKHIEQALQLGQERYHLATQAAAVGVWDWNLQTGEFYLDPVIKAILGYTNEEIPNDLNIWAGYIHPDDHEGVMAAAQAHIDGLTPDYAYEHRMLHKDGSVRWVYVHGKLIHDEQGRAIRMVGTDADITGRKAAEAQVQRQLDYVRALSAFSQTLLSPADNEAERRRLLSVAFQHLVKPTQATTIMMHRNVDDADLGLYGRLVAMAADLSRATDGTTQAILTEFRALLKQQLPALATRPDDFMASIFPWSIVPAEMIDQLAAGAWVGGPITEMYANAAVFRDFLLYQHNLQLLLIFPIHIDGQWWGTVSMTEGRPEPAGAKTEPMPLDAGEQRIWTEDEILLLRTAAEMLSSTLQRWQAEDQLRQINERLEQQVKIRTAALSETVELLQQEIQQRQQAQAETERVLASLEQRVAARTEELATFFDLTVLAGQAAHLNDVFDQALSRIVEVTHSRAICIHLFEPDQPGLQLAAQQNLPAEVRPRLQSVELSGHFHHWLQHPNDPLMTTTLSNMTLLPSTFRLPACQTYLGAQIRSGNRIAGLLSCYRFTGRGFGLDEIALITAIAEQMGMMLETHRLRQNAEAMAVLQERQRLARDLHDSVTQSLYSLSLFSRAGREAAEDGDIDRLNHSLRELEHNTLHALREMRLLLYELRPADLEQEGLIQAVKLRLNTVERRVGLRLDVQLDELPVLSPRCEVELYHVIVEAMNNVVKHAAATSLTLHLTSADRQLHLQIIDDGQGFDPAQPKGGMGLNNIRERIARLNGQLSLVSEPGNGTRLEAVIPLPTVEKT